MAFLQSPGNQPFLRAPAIVLWLIALLIGIFAVQTFLTPAQNAAIYAEYGFTPAHYSHAYVAQTGYSPGNLLERALPFVSYIFLHGSWSHVLINSVWLLAFGPVVARRFGTPLFFTFFLACGIAAAATHLAIFWGSTDPVVGASGSISGLMGAAFRMMPFEEGREGERLAPLLSRRILVWSLIWAVVNVIAGVTGLGTGGGPQVVAWGAHLGGYAAGLLLAGPVDRISFRPHQ